MVAKLRSGNGAKRAQALRPEHDDQIAHHRARGPAGTGRRLELAESGTPPRRGRRLVRLCARTGDSVFVADCNCEGRPGRTIRDRLAGTSLRRRIGPYVWSDNIRSTVRATNQISGWGIVNPLTRLHMIAASKLKLDVTFLQMVLAPVSEL